MSNSMELLQLMLSGDDFVTEWLDEDEYELLDEGAKKAYKRSTKGTGVTMYFRCVSGPKKGKLAKDPASCGRRPDPKKVRHGRRVAQRKGKVRARKTSIRKKTQLSKRITQLNRRLQGLNESSFISFLLQDDE